MSHKEDITGSLRLKQGGERFVSFLFCLNFTFLSKAEVAVLPPWYKVQVFLLDLVVSVLAALFRELEGSRKGSLSSGPVVYLFSLSLCNGRDECWNICKLGLIPCAWFLRPGKCCLASCRACRNAVAGMRVIYIDMSESNYYKITNCYTCYRCHLWGCEGALGFSGWRDNRPGFSHPWLFWTTGKLPEVSFLLTCLYLHNQCFAFGLRGPTQ